LPIEVDCPCGASFPASDELAGGITNCPSCGKAVDVPGLRDPFWRVCQVGAAIVWAGVTAVVFVQSGPLPGVLTGVILAGVILTISLAF
jgi:hypothetical protein